jgi:hypothetical protein
MVWYVRPKLGKKRLCDEEMEVAMGDQPSKWGLIIRAWFFSVSERVTHRKTCCTI